MARRVWGDELFALCALAALHAFPRYAAVLTAGTLDGSRPGACGYSILIKETGLVVLGLATAGFAIVAWRASGLAARPFVLLAGAATLAAAVQRSRSRARVRAVAGHVHARGGAGLRECLHAEVPDRRPRLLPARAVGCSQPLAEFLGADRRRGGGVAARLRR